MNKNLFNSSKLLALGTLATLVMSCDKEQPSTGTTTTSDQVRMHLGYGVNYSGEAEGYLLPLKDVTSGTITFEKNGFQLKPSRTHRVYASSDNKYLYSLGYGNAEIIKYETTGITAPFYQSLGEKVVQDAMGKTHVRWRKLDDQTAFVYEPMVEHKKGADGSYIGTEAKLRILPISLSGNMMVGKVKDVVLPKETDSSFDNLYISRVDQPVVSNGKIYFGVSKGAYIDGKDARTNGAYKASTLILDYPSFDNPRVIYSTLGQGETYGYRTPSFVVDEQGAVYNISMQKSRIYKINGDSYDDSYDFDLAKALGMEAVGGTGIFYAGNGIAYVPYYDATIGSDVRLAAWGVARVDLRNKTAIKLNVPEKLWLRYYQNAKLVDGKLYMALCPVDGSTGNIYIFDPTNATPNGFTKGATIKASGEGYYLGVF